MSLNVKSKECCVTGECVCAEYCPPNIRSICNKNDRLPEGETQAVVCFKRTINDLGRPMENYIQNGTPGVASV